MEEHERHGQAGRIDSVMCRFALVALVSLSIAGAGSPGAAVAFADREARVIASGTASGPDRNVPMTVTVIPRSKSSGLRDTALVYLDGRIDADAPRRLSEALDRLEGDVSVWLHSPGGNLFAGMEMGRLLRKRGASTYIMDHRTLRPGTCYSACAMTFLGGVYRFNQQGGRYGVHRASLLTGPDGKLDLGEHLTTVIGSYIREMGVDPRLLDLCLKAGRDEMYVLSAQEAKGLGVVNDGRQPPEWSTAAFPGGTALQGRQGTADGDGTVFFSCDGTQTLFGAIHESAGMGEPSAASAWTHSVTIGRSERLPLKALSVSNRDGVLRSTFVLPPNLVRLAMSARHVGYQLKPSPDAPPSIDYRVDIDGRSASMVKKFLRDCIRRPVSAK